MSKTGTSTPPAPGNKPEWLKVKFPAGENYRRIDQYHRVQGLHSVCRSAACPNQGECWNKGTATFMILGNNCTRTCSFCNIGNQTAGSPDPQEPKKVANAVAELKLNHAVITSVTRDDLADGGAGHFAALVREIRECSPNCTIELLIPDLLGNQEALATILQEAPHILGHNLETVPRLYSQVRPEANYQRSLNVLKQARTMAPAVIAKSGLMLGMGEEYAEVIAALHDLRDHGCQIVTLGQYLAPTREHYPLKRYVTPDEFADLATYGRRLGFDHVEAGPLVRSSYHAEEQFNAGKAATNG